MAARHKWKFDGWDIRVDSCNRRHSTKREICVKCGKFRQARRQEPCKGEVSDG